MDALPLLSIIVLAPLVAAALMLFVPGDSKGTTRILAVAASTVSLIGSLIVAWGYDTEVGEGGNQLSLGQKQLVSFARAVLKRPRLLVMDEATSSIDTETEQQIQSGLARLLAGRTSFVIAHRLSTIRAADLILVIEKGRIIEQGTHADLIRDGGRYHDLYTEQSERNIVRIDTVMASATD